MKIYTVSIMVEEKTKKREVPTKEEVSWALNTACSQLEDAGFDVQYRFVGGDSE